MSLLHKLLKLADDLDQKGLTAEADILDKAAGMLDKEKAFGGNLLTEDELMTHRHVENADFMEPEAYMDMFRELFMHNIEENHLGINEAVATTVREMNRLAEEIEESGAPTDEERAAADSMFKDMIS